MNFSKDQILMESHQGDSGRLNAIDLNQTGEIVVNWTGEVPNPSQYRSVKELAPKEQTPQDAATEDACCLPAGTIAWLHAAFAAGWSRDAGWDLSELHEASSAQEIYGAQAAAQIFRRGVARRGAVTHGGEVLAPLANAGCYRIHLLPFNAENSNESCIKQFLDAAEYVIVDQNVFQHWGHLFAANSAPRRKGQQIIILRLDELHKNLEAVGSILHGARSATKWCIVGGGLLTDVAAFAGALARAQLTFVPTTLLAMADACVGGKTGVNFYPYGKNQVGAFYFPQEVFVWPGWLHSLPLRELRAGLAECIKHAFLSGELRQAGKLDLRRVIEFKARIVAADPMEAGERAILNFGHTLAHALEAHVLQTKVTALASSEAWSILHGEAVAIGMVYAGIVSKYVVGMPQSDLDLLVAALHQARCLLPWSVLETLPVFKDPTQGWATLWSLMAQDKKNSSTAADGMGSVRFVLTEKCGKPHQNSGQWTATITAKVGEQAWQELLAILHRTSIASTDSVK